MKYAWVLISPLVLALTGLVALPRDAAPQLQPTSASAASDASANAPSHGFYWQLTAPQLVLPGTLLRATRHGHDSKGTRSDQEFFTISSTGENDVPDAALRAYRHAEKVMATAEPGCQISWTLLAAIGRVESNHGRFGGATLGADGVSRPGIRGPRLDGTGAFAAIADSDHGTLDHDTSWDRAVGQMQFLPQTWQAVARDGDGDGTKNPDDLDDSALGAAVYLCGAGGSLAGQAGMARAAFRYNHSDYYVQLVLSFQAGYQTGVFAVPTPPPPAEKAAKVGKHQAHQTPKSLKATATKHAKPRPKHTSTPVAPKPASQSTTQPKPTKAPQPAPKPAPKPVPKPTPKPTPVGPRLVHVDGTWTACGAAYCLNGTQLDLGPMSTSGTAPDFDGDGTTESSAGEFAGLVGQHVSLQVENRGGVYVVYVIGANGLRNADGSFARVLATSPAPTTGP